MKKTYGVVDVSAEEIAAETANNTAGGGSAVERPLLKIDGVNVEIIEGLFDLPDVKECEAATLQIGLRILGFPVTEKLLNHLPTNVTSEHLGCLVPQLPFCYHKRISDTWSDHICPESTRTNKCRACKARKELFTSEEYKSGVIQKDAILKDGGFGTRHTALIIARVFYDDQDMGIRALTVAVTNPKSTTSRKENFFDLIAQLKTKKKLSVSESLPTDYYSNGDGARWLIADYTRAIYQPDGEKDKKSKGHPYWKLSAIGHREEIEGVGKACDIWWPEVDGEDGAEIVDVYELLNMTPKEEFDAIAEAAYNAVLDSKGGNSSSTKDNASAGESVIDENYVMPNWTELNNMTPAELVEVGICKAGEGEREVLELLVKANPATLLRSVAKLGGVKPQRLVNPSPPAEEVEEDTAREDTDEIEEGDEDDLPF